MSPSDNKIGLKMNCVISRELYKADFRKIRKSFFHFLFCFVSKIHWKKYEFKTKHVLKPKKWIVIIVSHLNQSTI